MSSDSTYESYYVPHNSPLPIFASLGLFLTVYGGGSLLNEIQSGSGGNFRYDRVCDGRPDYGGHVVFLVL